MEIEPVYLGDGVYASFDGYHICLTLDDHRNPTMIALEPSVFRSLQHYAERIWGEQK
jgi:hypothetical protein